MLNPNRMNFKQVFVYGKDDLPKESGKYQCVFSDNTFGQATYDKSQEYASQSDIWLINKIKCYFQPLPEPAQGMPTELDAEKYAIDKYMNLFDEHESIRMFDYKHGFMSCFDWFKSRLAPSKQEPGPEVKMAAGLFIGAKNKEPEGKTAEFDHKIRHQELHNKFDELFADFIEHTKGGMSSTIKDLIEWSYSQTKEPTK